MFNQPIEKINHSSEKVPEAHLVLWLQLKDKKGLEYLYDRYTSALYGVIKGIVFQEEIADEVLQDTFLKIWVKFESYDPKKGRLFTWMMRVARHLAIDKVRSPEIKNGRRTDVINQEDMHNIDSRYYSHQSTDNIGISELLQLLRPEQQLVVELIYLKGYTQAEVTKEFGIPLGTVKTRLRSGLRDLRRLVG